MHRTRATVPALAAGILVAIFAGQACSRRPRSIERLAILPFENLTGDASLNWVASAAPAIVSDDLAGVRDAFAQPAGSTSDAYLANATRFVHGYFTGHAGALRIKVEVEDASRHKMIAEEAGTGDVLAALNGIAKGLDSSAHAFSTENPEAVAAWGHRDYERAAGIDPDFGAAWLGWVETLTQKGDAAQAVEVASRALARPSLRSNVDRARIALVSATLRRDPEARAKALSTLTRLMTTDVPLLEALAESELNARRFTSAAEVFKNILKLEPENAGAMNSLGYAQAYAGELDAAVKTFEAYGKIPDQKNNSLDSLGEACFMNGRFKDAQKYFMQAYDSNHAFLAGADLLKAAYAQWLAGDLKAADGLMARYLETRRNDPLRAWREATWDYATGRINDAENKLRAPLDVNVIVRQKEAWTRLDDRSVASPEDLERLKQLYARTPPAADGQVRAFYAAALVAAGQQDEERKLLGRWPLPAESGGDPMRESMVFPKFIEARRAAGLSVP